MTRSLTIRLTALAGLPVVEAWRFTSAAFVPQPGWRAPAFMPILPGVASMGLIMNGWQAAVLGPFALAGVLLGLSAAFTWRLFDPGHSTGLAGLGLVPALAGAGMLVEISRGQGWRFTRRLSYGLILGSAALTLGLSMLSASGKLLSADINQLHIIYPGLDGLLEIVQNLLAS